MMSVLECYGAGGYFYEIDKGLLTISFHDDVVHMPKFRCG